MKALRIEYMVHNTDETVVSCFSGMIQESQIDEAFRNYEALYGYGCVEIIDNDEEY